MGGKEARDAQYLGDADGLLFHRFVNCNLVFNVHLVKLIDAAHTVGGSARCSATGIAVPTKTQQNIYRRNANLLSASMSAPASMPNSPVSLSFTTLAVRPAADEACAPKPSELQQRQGSFAMKSQLKPERVSDLGTLHRTTPCRWYKSPLD